MTSRAAAVLLAALAASCGARLMKLPTGPGTPISEQDANATLVDATAGCSGIRALTAEVGVSGSAGGHRLRGRLLAGVDMPESARLEAVAPFGQPLFIFATTGGDATLLLPRDRRVLTHARPQEVLEAVTGVPLGAADLYTTLTGCPQAYSFAQGVAYGDDWRVIRASGGLWKTLYVRRQAAGQPWRLAAVLRDDVSWRVEYLDYEDARPRSIRLTGRGSQSTGSADFNLTLTLSQIETKVSLPPEAFTIQIPADAEPITLEELRRSGPLAP